MSLLYNYYNFVINWGEDVRYLKDFGYLLKMFLNFNPFAIDQSKGVKIDSWLSFQHGGWVTDEMCKIPSAETLKFFAYLPISLLIYRPQLSISELRRRFTRLWVFIFVYLLFKTQDINQFWNAILRPCTGPSGGCPHCRVPWQWASAMFSLPSQVDLKPPCWNKPSIFCQSLYFRGITSGVKPSVYK